MPSAEQLAEVAKYELMYRDPGYRMWDDRRGAVRAALDAIPRGSLLDVGAGRGETLEEAAALGFSPLAGTEVVSYLVGEPVVYGMLPDLPFPGRAFDVVTCFDVLEHLLPEDAAPALRELDRLARRVLLIAAADYPTSRGDVQLHPGARPYDDWERLIKAGTRGEVRDMGDTGTSRLWSVTYEL